jgi:D-3-phosphoglycerate dehydrogenase
MPRQCLNRAPRFAFGARRGHGEKLYQAARGALRPVTIIATGPVFPPAPDLLAGLGELVVAPSGAEEALIPLVGDAVALLVRGGSRVTARVIESAPSLRVIGRSGVGVDEIDVAAATRRGIPVVVTPEAGAQAVAEGAFALMLALAKRLRELDAAVRERRWADRDALELGDLDGETLGVVGYGRIGRRVAALGAAFGMEVIAADPYADADDVELVALPDLFARSRFVSLHAPLTAETHGLVHASLLDRLPKGAILVNLARGGLVRSLDDLLAALESGRLASVGLDVFEHEPPDLSHALFRHPNVLVSPHALGMSRRARERIFREVAAGIAAVLRGERPATVANPELYDR